MLRSVPERLCAKAAELFDNGIMTALAVMFEQAQVPTEMAYCDADPDKHVYPIFNLQRGRLGLPTYMAGVGLRAWREHRHAAFVGMVAQSCASWSAMTFEKHWLQRIGVTQARARAALLTEGVRSRQQAECEVPWGPGVETVSMQYEA